jgi:serine/threonine protein phosphatase 1
LADAIAFIGDIHGDSARLTALLGKLHNRKLVFLGDYVDHGAHSREVIKILLEIESREQNAVFLSGNHEIGLLAFLAGKLSFLEYAWMGGLSTIRSYVGKASEDVRNELLTCMPNAHYEFISNCKQFLETDHFVASHAGINPACPNNRDFGQIVLGRHPSLFDKDLRLSKLVICGHYLQETRTAFVAHDVICLNTGCGTINGPLTALLYPEMSLVQM